MTSITVNSTENTVRFTIPMQFKRRSSRKMIVGPDGKTIKAMASNASKADQTFVNALAKAFRWQTMLEDGTYASPKELAQREGMDITHLYRVMRLTLLAPDIIEAVLKGKQPRTLTLQNVIRGFPISWAQQRQKFGFDNI